MMAFDNPDVITIDPEFQAFIPPLTDEEFSRLEKKLLNEGVTEALKVWVHDGQDILVDGHNRYRIILEHGLDMPEPIYLSGLETRDDVKRWMIDNQLGRRNLTDFAKNEIVLREKELIAGQSKARQLSGLKKGDEVPLASIDANGETGKRTAEILAEKAGTSRASVERTDKILREATPEVIEKVRSGEMSQNAALKTLKKEEKPARPADVDPETGMTEEELMADSMDESLEEIVARQEKELRELRNRITSLTVTDKDAEIMKLKDIAFSHEQRIGMLTEQNHQKGQQLKYHAKLVGIVAEVRKELGIDSNNDIIPAIRKLKGL